jgi:hypothetical protein
MSPPNLVKLTALLRGRKEHFFHLASSRIQTSNLALLTARLPAAQFPVPPMTVFVSDRDKVVALIHFQSCGLHHVRSKGICCHSKVILQYNRFSIRPYFKGLVLF